MALVVTATFPEMVQVICPSRETSAGSKQPDPVGQQDSVAEVAKGVWAGTTHGCSLLLGYLCVHACVGGQP